MAKGSQMEDLWPECRSGRSVTKNEQEFKRWLSPVFPPKRIIHSLIAQVTEPIAS